MFIFRLFNLFEQPQKCPIHFAFGCIAVCCQSISPLIEHICPVRLSAETPVRLSIDDGLDNNRPMTQKQRHLMLSTRIWTLNGKFVHVVHCCYWFLLLRNQLGLSSDMGEMFVCINCANLIVNVQFQTLTRRNLLDVVELV
jgi:hypothetical protein